MYMVSGGLAQPCGRFPIPLTVCPTCSAGVKQTRTWVWVNPLELLKDQHCKIETQCHMCPMGNLAQFGTRAGLLWIGTQFYPTPESFQIEAGKMGVSRRINTVPKDFELGKTWVLMAHPKAILGPIEVNEESGEPEQRYVKGIVFAFKPDRIEKMVTEAELANQDEMMKLEVRGITPVVLPDIPIHRGSVYDKEVSQIDIDDDPDKAFPTLKSEAHTE
jgi:hypothetical protein